MLGLFFVQFWRFSLLFSFWIDIKVNSVYIFCMAYNVTEKRNKRKEQICASALEIILDGGLETLSMHTLAKRQGVTVGALYRYFRSKQELLAVLESDLPRTTGAKHWAIFIIDMIMKSVILVGGRERSGGSQEGINSI